jgi:hypothetical protein
VELVVVGYRYAVMAVLLFLLTPPDISADDLCELPQMRIDQRPEFGGQPSEVTMGILVADITAIDDVDQTLTGDFITEMSWVDDRLSGKVGCRFPLSKVWSPRIEALNSTTALAKRSFSRDQVEIEAGGRVRHYQRRFGPIATYHHLADFPFDPQVFRFRFTSFDYDANEIIIKADHELTRIADLINIPDWTIGKASGSVELIDMVELRSLRSIFILEIPATRNSNFYIWKVLVPLSFIVMMSWAVFWINPVKFGPQLGISATSMLTLIAFQFALTGILPKLSYFTTMDKLILGSSALVFLSFVESVLTIYLVSIGKESSAFQVDNICRWLFPVVFMVYSSIVIVT